MKIELRKAASLGAEILWKMQKMAFALLYGIKRPKVVSPLLILSGVRGRGVARRRKSAAAVMGC